jgi:hypothetical protein
MFRYPAVFGLGIAATGGPGPGDASSTFSGIHQEFRVDNDGYLPVGLAPWNAGVTHRYEEGDGTAAAQFAGRSDGQADG